MDGGNLTPLAMKDLLEAGVHFGHQTKRWNPKMKPFIFGERSGIYILDLGKTVKHYRAAEDFVRQLAAEGKSILFVGTKRQAQDVVAEEATRCGMYYVNERWLGGLLTNFTTIQRSLNRLRDLEAMSTDGAILLGLAAQNEGELKVVGEEFSEERIGVGYSLETPEMCEWINGVLEEAYEDGSWAAAFEATLGGDDVETPDPPALDECQA